VPNISATETVQVASISIVASSLAVGSDKPLAALSQKFKRPVTSSKAAFAVRNVNAAPITAIASANKESLAECVYYNVMFTKDPYTKKRRRMSDGVLSLNGRQAALYDDAGTLTSQPFANACKREPISHRQITC
jgi:hypothetical protein